ncbi:hypothetical protein LIER_39170 [Lithospermum erythrorhizon]|uniref:Gnk2-homologous domain-containing protein n=1 Tax=Lithospermum erythrorhizon TaxID=34254 RepID=A0AAV3QC88_LITER
MAQIYHFFILFLLSISIAESADPTGEFCNKATKIKRPQISSNIKSLLSILVSGTTKNGFTISSYGQAEDQVFGLAQCRGDVSQEDCSICIQDAAKEITKRCTNEADARIWYDYCFLRYNTNKFLGQVDTSYGIFYWNVNNVTGVEDFNKSLGNLVDEVSSQAVKNGNKGLGKGKKKLSDFLTLYALVQCTRDLEPLSCAQCLAIAVGNFPTYCDNKQGCRVFYSSCSLRYELYPFYFPLDAQNTKQDAQVKYHIVSKA